MTGMYFSPRRYRISHDRDPQSTAHWDVHELGWKYPRHSGHIKSFESFRAAWDWLSGQGWADMNNYHDALCWRNVGESLYYEKRRQERNERHQRPEA